MGKKWLDLSKTLRDGLREAQKEVWMIYWLNDVAGIYGSGMERDDGEKEEKKRDKLKPQGFHYQAVCMMDGMEVMYVSDWRESVAVWCSRP